MDYSKVCGTDCEVGEEFYYKGVKLKALELKSKFEFQCEDCYFYNNNCEMIACRSSERKDRKCVKFVEVKKETKDNDEFSDKHYNFKYKLSDKDIEAGFIKIDPYFITKEWKLNSKDDTGILFHSLKTLCRFGEKNSIEREIKALNAQIVRLAEINDVKL